ncbi:MAG: succinylglutamate desuccinylase/aspartoacylase family protein [Acidobacteria bacterium]|nr:succinylglutamate desuccinylase/aspartoacylase family protein [Acidobacteriota bacterium]
MTENRTPSNGRFCDGEHLIAAFSGDPAGPTLIVVGSLHGNESAGAVALSEMAENVATIQDSLKGRVYFLAGNTRALSRGVRFVDADLNRHWTPGNMSGSSANLSEDIELAEIVQQLDGILITAMDEVFVLDLHSTSADGLHFATVGDTLRNRAFAQKFPVTILLGIEEQLEGTMLEYLNNAGAVTLGFEGGQHESDRTVENHKAMVWLAMFNAGIIGASAIPDLDKYREHLATGEYDSHIFEIRIRHAISNNDSFRMQPGFKNFDPIHRGDLLGNDKSGPVTATESGVIMMPLYQTLGEDGFFIGREISPFWLWLSGLLRRLGIQKMIHILPGVSRVPGDPSTLNVNTAVARLFPLQVFHLLGFRRRRWDGNKLTVSRRKHDTTGPFKWKGEANG